MAPDIPKLDNWDIKLTFMKQQKGNFRWKKMFFSLSGDFK